MRTLEILALIVVLIMLLVVDSKQSQGLKKMDSLRDRIEFCKGIL